MNNQLLIILGPTATGKTRLAVNVAERLNGEIISADSRQVFNGMDLGTGKDLSEYQVKGREIPYHLINIREAGEKYNVNLFKDDFYDVFERIISHYKLPILCGGTGMYIHTLLQKQDFTAIPVNKTLRDILETEEKETLQQKLKLYPAAFTAHADLSSQKRMIRAIEVAEYLTNNKLEEKVRPALSPCIVGLYLDRELLKKRIYDRLHQRFEEGMIAEVETLLNNGVPAEMLSFYGLEYKFITMYLTGDLTAEQMKERLYTAICQFAKRQVTFFKKMEKDGVKINWLNVKNGLENLTESVISLKENTVSKV